MTIDELENIWYDGKRQDPNFINMTYNMLGMYKEDKDE